MKLLRLWKPCHAVPYLVLHQSDERGHVEFGYMDDHDRKPEGACIGHLHIVGNHGSERMQVRVTQQGEKETWPGGMCWDVAFDVQPVGNAGSLPCWGVTVVEHPFRHIDLQVPDDAEWKWVEYGLEPA